MGGTFDPIHNGHLVAASEVANMFDLDEVVFVPTGEPWQKSGKKVSAAEDRYLMTVIATASNPRFKVSRVDIDRSGPTYTVDTLRDLRRFYPDAELFFITGADALASIVTWRDWEDMFEHARFVGVTRPGYELDDAILPEVHRERWLIFLPWPFRRRIAGSGRRRNARCGIWCRMVWCSTSLSTGCMCLPPGR